MGRLTLDLDPMPTHRIVAGAIIDAHFDRMSGGHREHAHAQKRLLALSFLAGEPAANLLIEEAKLRGITTKELAQMIVSKPNMIARRELKRQELHLKIEAATSLDELEKIKTEAGKLTFV